MLTVLIALFVVESIALVAGYCWTEPMFRLGLRTIPVTTPTLRIERDLLPAPLGR